jgi:hypothetical protein
MRIVITFFQRVIQLLGLISILIGCNFATELWQVVDRIITGQPWELLDLYRYLAGTSLAICIGLGLIVLIEFIRKLNRYENAARELHPQEPWLWREDWASGLITLSNKGTVIFLMIYAFCFLTIVLPGGLAFALLKPEAKYFIYCFVGFIGFFGYALLRMLFKSWSWGRSSLKLGNLPGVIGGPCSGVIVLSDATPEDMAYRITLICEQTEQRSNTQQSNNSTSTNVLWQEERFIDKFLPSEQPHTTAIPFYFAIPFDSEESGQAHSWREHLLDTGRTRVSETIRWWVKLAPKNTEDMREVKFEIPVFKTAESSPTYEPRAELIEPFLERLTPEAAIKAVPHAHEFLPDGERWSFFEYKADIFLGLVLMTLICGTGSAAILYYVQPAAARYIALLIPGALTVICSIGIFIILFWKSMIDKTTAGWSITSGYWGFRRTVFIERAQGLQFQAKKASQEPSSKFWKVDILVPDQQPITLVNSLDGQQLANSVVRWLQANLRHATQ